MPLRIIRRSPSAPASEDEAHCHRATLSELQAEAGEHVLDMSAG